MSKIFYPDFFNDVFGPIMQPGSSGGFAGPARIGNVSKSLLQEEVRKVVFSFQQKDIGLFKSLGNFMTDRGYLGGALGFKPDDQTLFDAHRIAKERRVSYEFRLDGQNFGYSGAVKIEVYGESEKGELIGASVGGGMIKIYEVNGYKINWQGDTFGSLIADIVEIDTVFQKYKEEYKDHIVEHYIVEGVDGNKALFLETDIDISGAHIINDNQIKPIYLPAVLPVVTSNARKEQLFTTIDEWRAVAKERNITFLQAAIEYEKDFSGWSEEEIWTYFTKIRDIFDLQVHSLEDRNYEVDATPMLPIYGKNWKRYLDKGKVVSDKLTQHILTHAYATNAKVPGVIIVPGPMGTGGGYLYSALDAVREERGYSRQKELEALVIAAALGALAYTYTNASGERGCVGESGVCNAMAAGAIAYMISDEEDPLVEVGIAVERAASMALQANMGIVCDPIPGGLEFPCLTRTIRAAVTAPMYAEMAIIGIDPLIPYHECLQAIEKHYNTVPRSTLCGSECGTCTTKTAARCKSFLRDLMADNLKYDAN